MRFTIENSLNPFQLKEDVWIFTLSFEIHNSLGFEDFDMRVNSKEKKLIELLNQKYEEGHYMTFKEMDDALSGDDGK